MKKILITGDCGFIGSHVAALFVSKYPEYEIHGLDALTYASNSKWIDSLKKCSNYKFVRLDIRDRNRVMELFEAERYTDVIHLAAESHVDNSIENPLIFAETNIIGTLNLLDSFREYSSGRFHHVSTDEVYGDLSMEDPAFQETTSYDPSSPYSASKAASDHFVRAYHRTYGIDTTITNCSNNFGPHQHYEKFIPKIIASILANEEIPIYGKGENVRDWLFVKDHAIAIDNVFRLGVSGETYNVGGDKELSNIELVYLICAIMKNQGYHEDPESLITFIDDRAGHDLRYAINSDKITSTLEWMPAPEQFEERLLETIDWYVQIYNTNKNT